MASRNAPTLSGTRRSSKLHARPRPPRKVRWRPDQGEVRYSRGEHAPDDELHHAVAVPSDTRCETHQIVKDTDREFQGTHNIHVFMQISPTSRLEITRGQRSMIDDAMIIDCSSITLLCNLPHQYSPLPAYYLECTVILSNCKVAKMVRMKMTARHTTAMHGKRIRQWFAFEEQQSDCVAELKSCLASLSNPKLEVLPRVVPAKSLQIWGEASSRIGRCLEHPVRHAVHLRAPYTRQLRP